MTAYHLTHLKQLEAESIHIIREVPVAGSDELKQTNEIGMFIPTLDGLADIADKTMTGDALLTQRKLAQYIVEDRLAHYVFTAKDNQLTLAQDIRLAFKSPSG